jgi:hypothetical protein
MRISSNIPHQYIKHIHLIYRDITLEKFRVISRNGDFYTSSINLYDLLNCVKCALDTEDIATGNIDVALISSEGSMAGERLNVQ